MPENILQIIIRARDEATKVLGVTDKQLNGLGESVSKAGNKFLIAGTAMAAGLGVAIKKAGDFQEQMSFVATMLGDQSEKYMPGFESALKRMSTTYGQSTATLSKGLYDILSASIPAEKAARFLEVSVRSAEAGFVEAGLTADALTTVVNAYSLGAEKAGDVSDWFFSIVEKGKTTMAELAPSIGLVLPLSKQLGVSLDEVGASLTVMTRAGIKTDIAVTSLRSIMGAFLKPTKELAEETKKWGFESAQAAMKQLGMAGVLERLAKIDSVRLPQMIEEKRALTGLLTILDKKNEFMADSITISERAGKTDEMLAKRQDNLNVQMRKLKETVNILMVDVGTILIPVIKDLAERVVENIDKFRDFVKENKGLIENVAILTPAILLLSGAFLKIVGVGLQMVSVISKLVPLIKALGLTTGGIPAIIGMAVAAVALLTVEFIKAEKAVKNFEKAADENLKGIDKQVEKMKEWEGTHQALLLVKANLLQRGAEETSEDITNLDARIAKLKEKESVESAAGEAAAEAAAKEAEAKIGALEEISEAEKEARETKRESTEELREEIEVMNMTDHELAMYRIEEELQKYKDAKVEEVDIAALRKEKVLELAESEKKAKDKLVDEEVNKKLAANKKMTDAAMKFTGDAINLITDIAKDDLENNKKRYDDAVKRGTMTQEEADKAYAKDKEGFKKIQKANAYISGALGIQKAIVSVAAIPFPLNVAAGILAIAYQKRMTGQQVASIESAAEGKIFMSPALTTIAEKGPEAAIPLSKFPMMGKQGIVIGDIIINLNIERLEALETENLEMILKNINQAVRDRVIDAVEMAQGIHTLGTEMGGLSE